MTARFIVTGTDTNVGKTIFCAALVHALRAAYWKPVQAGLDGETDTDTVRRLAGLSAQRLFPEAYRLRLAASPHLAAEHEEIEITAAALRLPSSRLPLVIEGAGGLLVPLSRTLLQIDLFAAWDVPLILCARTSLGTINHTLLSIEALRRRAMRLHGIAFIGDATPDVEETIAEFGQTRRLGRLPWLGALTAPSLHDAFQESFVRGGIPAF